MEPVLKLFLARHKQIEKKLKGVGITYPGLERGIPRAIDLITPAQMLMNTTVDVDDGNFGSWIPGLPLAAQIAAKRRITVDIVPGLLENWRRNFGISEKATIAFGRHKILLFNIRDFDPEGSEKEMAAAAAAYRPHLPFLERLFEHAGDSVYFLPTLRTRIFDAIPATSSGEQATLRARYDAAMTALAPAAKAAADLPDSDPFVRTSMFRGERPPLRATAWHWAYVKAMARFIDPDVMRDLERSYRNLSEIKGDHFIAGTLFLSFQNRLRYLHLIHSAPLSASFGGPYSFSVENEAVFAQAVQQESERKIFEYDYYPDDVMLLIFDLQMGHLRENFRKFIDDRLWESVKYMAATTYERLTTDAYFDHYDDDENIGEMIAYFEGEPNTHLGYVGLEMEMNALLANSDAIESRHLVGLATRSAELLHAKAAALHRATQGAQTARLAGPGDASRIQSQVRETNPRMTAIIFHLLRNMGFNFRNQFPAFGRFGDFPRSGWSAFSPFKLPPM